MCDSNNINRSFNGEAAGQAQAIRKTTLIEGNSPEVPATVGYVLDQRIASVRKHLEELCIQKAKADTAGLLNFPYTFIRDLI